MYFCIGSAYAIDYKSDLNSIAYGENSTEIINKAKLLEKYARNYKSELIRVHSLFQIKNSTVLRESNEEIENMIDALVKIQSKYIAQEDADQVLASIVEWLKDVNQKVEPYIKIQQGIYQEKLERTKNRYIEIGVRISDALLAFIRKLSTSLNRIEKLTPDQKEVVKSLARLNEEREKIQWFERSRFKTTNEMKLYYIEIIKSIRKEIILIRELLWN